MLLLKTKIDYIKYVTVGFLIFLIGCTGNECRNTINGENVILSEEILSLVSNYNEADKIIFKDQNENEIAFKVEPIFTTSDEYSYSTECDEDQTIFQTVKGNSERMELVLTSEDENIDSIFITILELPNPSDQTFSESLTISCNKLFSDLNTQEDILFGYTQGLNDINFFDSLKIRDQIFFNVLEPDLTWIPKLDIKFTKTDGIIYINDPTNEIELTYNRKE